MNNDRTPVNLQVLGTFGLGFLVLGCFGIYNNTVTYFDVRARIQEHEQRGGVVFGFEDPRERIQGFIVVSAVLAFIGILMFASAHTQEKERKKRVHAAELDAIALLKKQTAGDSESA